MINGSDWSQFIPDLVNGLLILLIASVGTIITYIKSERFRGWFKKWLNWLAIRLKWLHAKRRFIGSIGFILILGIIIFRIYSDWKIVTVSLICYVAGLLSWRFSSNSHLFSSRYKPAKSKTKFLPIAVFPGIGNSYLSNRFIAPPFGDVILGGVQFQFKTDSLIFDTDEQISYYLPRDDGGKEIEFQLPKSENQVKAVYLLINSGNSKSVYAHETIGKIRLIFKDAPPIVIKLVLGQNIREWCPGNPGDYVREASSSMITMGMWTGLSKQGANAVMDCLQIPVYECMRNCFLEKIIFVHKPTQHPSDTMGVHFSVFAVTLELEQHI